MTVLRSIIGPLGRPGTYGSLAYLASGLPLGVAWFVILVVGYALGFGLIITLVGIPILLGMVHVTAVLATVERHLAGALLGTEITSAARPLRGGLVARLRGWAADPARWRELVYLVLRATVGVAAAIGVIALVGAALSMLTYPAYYWTGSGTVVGDWRSDSLGTAIVACLVGLVLIPATAWAVVGLGRVNRAVAEALLGRVPGRPVVSRRALRVVSVRALVWEASLAGALVIICIGIWGVTTPGHYIWPAWVALGLSIPLGVHVITLIVPPISGPRGVSLRPLIITAALAVFVFLEATAIWGLTTPTGYFWPAWVLLGMAIPVGVHAIWLLVPGQSRRRRALAVHAAAVGLIMLVLTLVWAGTTPGDTYWPAWVLLGLAIPLGVHALIQALSDRETTALAERVEVLTSTRAAAVDAQAAELQRIERDLHDGAQARLTALAMELGMARERLETQPAEAATLVAQAHEDAKRALAELRDLARGIHPAVLTDRGLDAALSALAGSSPIPVELTVRTGGRLPAAVEAAAYFVVTEALANAHKHSAASRIRVLIDRRGPVLVVEVDDDGAGGADPGGSGLDGLRRRVEALDGRLYVDSPPFRGTRIQAEIPCGS